MPHFSFLSRTSSIGKERQSLSVNKLTTVANGPCGVECRQNNTFAIGTLVGVTICLLQFVGMIPVFRHSRVCNHRRVAVVDQRKFDVDNIQVQKETKTIESIRLQIQKWLQLAVFTGLTTSNAGRMHPNNGTSRYGTGRLPIMQNRSSYNRL